MGITAGTSLNKGKALVKALGEGVERYCAGSYNSHELIYASYSELKSSAIHPSTFKLYLENQFSHKQFPLVKFEINTKIYWTSAINPLSKKQYYVPAELVYCPFVLDTIEENIAESISTGLAAHCSFNEAAINGFLEVVERNNFMFSWLTKTTPLLVSQDSLHKEHATLIDLYESYGYKVDICYNPGKDGIPSFIALVKGSRPYNVPLLIAAATHLDPSVAVTKCLEEIALMERLCQQKMLDPSALASVADYSKVTSLLDHVMIWLNPEMWHHANFLISNNQSIDLSEIPNKLTNVPELDLLHIINSIEKLGYQTFIADVTPEDIQRLGLCTVRAMVPAYLPLNKSYHCKPLGAKYLTDYLNVDKTKFQINQIPHPFA